MNNTAQLISVLMCLLRLGWSAWLLAQLAAVWCTELLARLWDRVAVTRSMSCNVLDACKLQTRAVVCYDSHVAEGGACTAHCSMAQGLTAHAVTSQSTTQVPPCTVPLNLHNILPAWRRA